MSILGGGCRYLSTVRSFISFDVDSEEVIDNIMRVQNVLLETGADLKLVKPENIHVTIKFLGEVPSTMIDNIYEVLRDVSFTPFKIRVKGLGSFPNFKVVRVVWAGIVEGCEDLREIHLQVERGLRTLGFKPDPKGFSPHLTIARVRSGRRRDLLIKCIKRMCDYEFGVVEARCLRLKKSVLTPRGPVYSVLREVCR